MVKPFLFLFINEGTSVIMKSPQPASHYFSYETYASVNTFSIFGEAFGPITLEISVMGESSNVAGVGYTLKKLDGFTRFLVRYFVISVRQFFCVTVFLQCYLASHNSFLGSASSHLISLNRSSFMNIS